MIADVIDRTLSIAGVVIALGSATTALLVYRRDRPRLAFNWAIRVNPAGEETRLDVSVVNDGRQPIGLASVRVANARPTTRLSRMLLRLAVTPRLRKRIGTGSDRRTSMPPRTGPMLSLLLQPGEHAEFEFPLSSLLELGRQQLYLVAADPLGRECTEALGPVVTEAIGNLVSGAIG